MDKWVQIKNLNYEINENGDVRNIKTKKIRIPVIAGNINSKYLQIQLYDNGKPKSYYISRLVAETFIKNNNPNEYTQVDHIDRNKNNNHVSNLRWVSPTINCLNKNNTSPYIYKYKNRNKPYCFHNIHNNTYKYFETLEEAINYKNDLVYINNEVEHNQIAES